MKNHWMQLQQLDRQLSVLKNNHAESRPSIGWVRCIRKTLGMTIKQLAIRLQVDPSRVVKIEMSEVEGAVTLRTMHEVALQLNCHFAYQFIPHTSLEDCVHTRAKTLAAKIIERTAHTMDLESQSVDAIWIEKQIVELTESLLQKSWRMLWKEDV
jgi:predicted DNA-binding mobile mystery protein A